MTGSNDAPTADDDLRPESFDAREPGRGRAAASPGQIPLRGWLDILSRTVNAFFVQRLMFVAGGVTFFSLLALFPGLSAFVSLYGLFFDPATAYRHLEILEDAVPEGVLLFIGDQMVRLAATRTQELGITFATSLVIALWSANAAVKWLIYGLNVAYQEIEKRNIVKYNLMTMGMTLGALVFMLLVVSSVVLLPVAYAIIGLGPVFDVAPLRWPFLFVVYVGALTLLYRYGPCRTRPKWRWLTWGGGTAAVLSVTASSLLSWWITNIADFQATYGPLGAAMGFMFWTWISVGIVLLGAALNAEIEHQTAQDTTTGPEKPMGRRGAIVADTIGPPRGSGPGLLGAARRQVGALRDRLSRRKPAEDDEPPPPAEP